jgi:hypothetical protein
MQKILFCNKFIIRLYMFRALCVHHQEVKIVLYSIWYHHTCWWPSRAQVFSEPFCVYLSESVTAVILHNFFFIYILLTVHLSIILVINQPNAQILVL